MSYYSLEVFLLEHFYLFASGELFSRHNDMKKLWMLKVELTDSEAWSMWVVSPSSSSSLTVAAVQRRHVASLAVVCTFALAAAHLADCRRKHHLDPLQPSSSSSCGHLPISWQRRDEKDKDRGQKAAELRLQHVECCSQSFWVCCIVQTPKPLPSNATPLSLSLFLSSQNERLRKKGGKEGRKRPHAFPSLSALFFPKHYWARASEQQCLSTKWESGREIIESSVQDWALLQTKCLAGICSISWTDRVRERKRKN